jgi:hypothetical protein
MKHVIRHGVNQAQAKQAIETAIEVYTRKFPDYHPRTQWKSDTKAEVSFKVKGMTLTTTIEIKPETIESDMDVPFLFRPFKSRALKVIDSEVEKWLARAKAGEIRA